MKRIWHQMPHFLPTDGSEVYCRSTPYYSPPYLATWDLATQQFTTTENSLVVPWYWVRSWKHQPPDPDWPWPP